MLLDEGASEQDLLAQDWITDEVPLHFPSLPIIKSQVAEVP